MSLVTAVTFLRETRKGTQNYSNRLHTAQKPAAEVFMVIFRAAQGVPSLQPFFFDIFGWNLGKK